MEITLTAATRYRFCSPASGEFVAMSGLTGGFVIDFSVLTVKDMRGGLIFQNGGNGKRVTVEDFAATQTTTITMSDVGITGRVQGLFANNPPIRVILAPRTVLRGSRDYIIVPGKLSNVYYSGSGNVLVQTPIRNLFHTGSGQVTVNFAIERDVEVKGVGTLTVLGIVGRKVHNDGGTVALTGGVTSVEQIHNERGTLTVNGDPVPSAVFRTFY